MDDVIKDLCERGIISIDKLIPYLPQIDRQGNYIQEPEHPASVDCFKLQRFLNYEIELN